MTFVRLKLVLFEIVKYLELNFDSPIDFVTSAVAKLIWFKMKEEPIKGSRVH